MSPIWKSAVVCSLSLFCTAAFGAIATQHPRLLLTPADVATIRANLGKYPMYDAAVAEAREQVDRALQLPISVPIPRDAAGETHERHKRNYFEMQLAGFLYQVTGDARYATFVKEMLNRYADLYPKLGSHPAGKGAAPGRLFWQTLNEAVWLVNTSQAYDCIYDTLSADERTRIEANVLRPMAKFLSEDRVKEFDRIHNHGTWAATAVGIAGYAMGDETLVNKALRGSKMDGSAGYLRQLDELFSPDGYYCEGPYYTRYALMPFVLFAHVVDHNDPTAKIFDHRNTLLKQAIYAALQQTSPTGAFIPFNDALKDKDIRSEEIVFAVDVAFARYGHDAHLLSIARRQGMVCLAGAGLEVAKALASTANPPEFPFASVEYRDGAKGEAGGVGILRGGVAGDQSLALMKYSAFGMEHGHYDKLQFIYYDQGREIIPDYGAARFLNVEQKDGGRYLRENSSFAKQTIAHNTVVVDERSNYGGSYEKAENEHAERQFFDVKDPNFQVMSAADHTAYPGVLMQRTIAMIRDAKLLYPVVVDVFRLTSDQPHRFDYPLYYTGSFLQTNAKLTPYTTARPVLGAKAGYQHLWVAAEGQTNGSISFTWMNGDRYYTATGAADPNTHEYLLQVGANDPDFDLRNENALLLRASNQSSHVFATVIEPHGRWDGVKEQTFGGESSIKSVTVLANSDEGTVVRITGDHELVWLLLIANAHFGTATHHTVAGATETFSWDGDAVLRKN